MGIEAFDQFSILVAAGILVLFPVSATIYWNRKYGHKETVSYDSKLSRKSLAPLPPGIRDGYNWLAERRVFEAPKDKKNLWKIRGKWYNLENFISRHPGGEAWLRLTRGTECTEAFEAHHIHIEKALNVMEKYYVCDASESESLERFQYPSPFYQELRQRVAEKLGRRMGPTNAMLMWCTIQLILFFVAFGLTAYYKSVGFALITGVTLNGVWAVGHNFFHQRDTFWRYAFDLTLVSHDEWRVTHALSHHLYPNTYLDIEVAGMEPFLYYTSLAKRYFLYKYIALIFYQLFYMCIFLIQFFGRWINVALGRFTFRPEFLINLVQFAFLYYGTTFGEAFKLWLIMHMTSSWMVANLGVIVHHHPAAWHEGDPVKTEDWALYEVVSTHDYNLGTPRLLSFMFYCGLNDHILHHLFPTIDMSRFPEIKPILVELLKKHGYKYEPTTWMELYSGCVHRLATEGIIHLSFG